MARAIGDLYGHIRHLVPELARFGVVGGIGSVVDLGGAAVLHSGYHMGPLASKAISITAATIVTYLGSRFWTFRHRENQPVHREAVLFFVLNVAGLALAEVVIALTTYGLDLKGPLAYNAASLAGTGLGTIFRFYAYRRWVFLAPVGAPAQSLAAADAVGEDVPDFPPWELDPEFFDRPVEYSRQLPLDDPFIPNGPAAPPLVTAAAPAWDGATRESPTWEVPASLGTLMERSAWESPRWETPGWETPGWETPAGETPAREAPKPVPSARPAPAAHRTPGRHRKH